MTGDGATSRAIGFQTETVPFLAVTYLAFRSGKSPRHTDSMRCDERGPIGPMPA